MHSKLIQKPGKILEKEALSQLPFFFVIYASFLAFFDKFLNSTYLKISADISLISIIIIIFILKHLKNRLNSKNIKNRLNLLKIYTYYFSPLFMVIIVIAIYNYMNGRSLLNGSGIFGIIINVFIFSFIFSYSRINIVSLCKQVSIIFSIHIAYITLETYYLLLGIQKLLMGITQEYRHLPGQPIYKILGIDIFIGGANGILMAPQVASQFIALAIMWFAPLYQINFTGFSKQSASNLFVLSVILYPFCMTNTSVIMLVLMFLVALFLTPKELLKIKKWKTIIILLTIIFIFNEKIITAITYRIKNEEILKRYIEIFMDPIIKFIELPLNLMIFGMQGNKSNLIYSDFGFGMIIWTAGILLSATSIFIIISLLVIIYKYVLNAEKMEANFNLRIVSVALIIQLCGWITSTVHYLVVMNIGGKQTFAFFIAIAVYIFMIQKESKNNLNLAHL